MENKPKTIVELAWYLQVKLTEAEFVDAFIRIRTELKELRLAAGQVFIEERQRAYNHWHSLESANMIHIDKLKAMTIGDFLREYGECE
jgi:hypothetical protein